MGRRSPTESITAIYEAFVHQRTWRQPDLAKRVELKVPALRKKLLELTLAGMPLHTDTEQPSEVYWSVPQGWHPGGVALPSDLLPDLLYVLLHTKGSKGGRRVHDFVLGAVRKPPIPVVEGAVVTGTMSEAEEKFLPTAEESMAERRALRVRYESKTVEVRHVSVHRVFADGMARMAVMCHRDRHLKWFVAARLHAAEMDESEPFLEVDPAVLEEFVATSVDGFHGGEPATTHVFFVRDPDAHWVKRTLLPPMQAEAVDGGIRVTTRAAGATRVARYVVGLGGAARCETEALRAEVERLARGALQQ